MRPVRLGFIGAGWWATSNHMPILRRRQDVELVGVASLPGPELAEVKERFGFAHATSSVEALLALSLDGVVISSPHDLHSAHALMALRAGCHVLVEKPFSLDPESAREIAALAGASGRIVLVPYGWNYMPFLEEARRLVREGGTGPIDYVLCHMASPNRGLFAGAGSSFEGWQPTIVQSALSTWQDPARGGGYAHGQVTHAAALLFWLTDLQPSSVQSCIMSRAEARVDLYDSAIVTFTSGAIGTVSGAAALPDNDPFQLDIRIFGREGTLLVDVERERVELRRYDGHHVSVPVEAGAGAYRCDVPPNRFVELIRGHGENNSDAEVALRSVEMIDAMHRSWRTGSPADILARVVHP